MITCPYCLSEALLQSSEKIYGAGRDYGMMYICMNYPKCDSYVGVHKANNEPLGRMANRELRELKVEAHKYFDQLWERKIAKGASKRAARTSAYIWLSKQLGIDIDSCHIGMFDNDMCRQVIKICKPYCRG